jgi:hypothetical protein
VTTPLGDFLAEGLDALGGDLGGSDERLDIALGEIGHLFGDAGVALDGGLGALVDVAENGLDAVGDLIGFILHGLGSFFNAVLNSLGSVRTAARAAVLGRLGACGLGRLAAVLRAVLAGLDAHRLAGACACAARAWRPFARRGFAGLRRAGRGLGGDGRSLGGSLGDRERQPSRLRRRSGGLGSVAFGVCVSVFWSERAFT